MKAVSELNLQQVLDELEICRSPGQDLQEFMQRRKQLWRRLDALTKRTGNGSPSRPDLPPSAA